MTEYNNILIKNIYYMLTYAFSSLSKLDYENIAAENFDNIQNLIAAILSKGISYQLKQGLYREYISKSENLAILKGKINIAQTIKNDIQGKKVLNCDYDELSENNVLNQIIKTTVDFLIRSDEVESKYKDKLKNEMRFFSYVDTILPSSINWRRIQINRNYKNYEMLIGLCKFVLEGMLLTTESGEYKMMSFVNDEKMCKLYEKFVLEYYKKEYKGKLYVSAPEIDWQLDEKVDNNSMLPRMKTDITISDKNSNVLIIDTKFYKHNFQTNYDKKILISNNLYQIFTYVKNKEYELKSVENHKVSGMLLYAETQDEVQVNEHFWMSENEIEVKTLDLNKDFNLIKKQLNNIVLHYFNINN